MLGANVNKVIENSLNVKVTEDHITVSIFISKKDVVGPIEHNAPY